MAHADIDLVVFDLGGVLVELGGIDVWLGWTGPGISEAEMWRQWLSSTTVRDFEGGRIGGR